MRFALKEKLLAWGDDYYIRDESGREVYFVDGKALSFGDQLSFQDMQRNELAAIKQVVFSWGPTYEIHRGGALAAVVKKELFTFFRHVFHVDVPGPDDLVIEGDFFDHEYAFSRQGRMVAQVSKRWFAWSDTYGVDVQDGEDAILILSSAVVVDQICHDDRNRR